MKNNDFLTNLFQVVGFLAAIIIAISQYIFSNQFKGLFIGNEQIYYLANTCVLGISLVSIIGLYANRFLIENKHYFTEKSKVDYYTKLNQSIGTNQAIKEPWNWKISDFGVVFLLVAMISFYYLISERNIVGLSIAYTSFICSTIDSIAIFVLKIYNQQEWRNSEYRNRDRIIEKINKYFAGSFRISEEFKDDSNFMYQSRTIMVEKDNKKYKVISDANNPDKYFSIVELPQ